jgi:hypothetical protein
MDRHAWSEALTLLKQADAANELDADGLELLAGMGIHEGQDASAVPPKQGRSSSARQRSTRRRRRIRP